jgi:D-glycero-alpha-D-manno-heptose-7-phosphate kinase
MQATKHFVVSEEATLTDVFYAIEQNQNRSAFVQNSKGVIVGIVSDGDIRRYLLKDPNMNASVKACMNSSFVFATVGASREYVLKLLDHRVQIVPILDKEGKLVEIITAKDYPLEQEKNTVIRARSPVRISFGGGGTDLTHYFVKNQVGVVMNATIKMYSHSSLKKRKDKKIIIDSTDLGERVEIATLEELGNFPKFQLINSLLRLIRPDYGFELSIFSDFPVGSGLGGSAVVLSSIIGCFNQLREDPWDRHEIAELAFQAERIFLKMQGGWQDQYATVFGGFNFIEFKESENIVHPLRIKKETILELEGNLILCNSREAHVSGDIHADQKVQFEKSEAIQDQVHKNKELCYQMKSLLLRGQLNEFGRSLDQAWKLKRTFSAGISSNRLDKIYEEAIEAGALGGKLLGAGGGGFFLFYVVPEKRAALIQKLEGMGLETKPVHFDDDGLQVWTVRLD